MKSHELGEEIKRKKWEIKQKFKDFLESKELTTKASREVFG
jgi:hypothetical protein